MDSINIAKRVFNSEIAALNSVYNNLDETFDKILYEIMNCKGKVIITGMGKSGIVGRKIAATMASLGSCAVYLHPGECMHGDLGMIQQQDVVIAISYSGESEEIVKIIPSIRIIGAKLIGITSNANSTLVNSSCISQIFPNIIEACHLGLAPTTSTTVAMVYGDALSVAASELKGFGMNDFGIFHPAGSLGKKLIIRVTDLMKRICKKDAVNEDATIMEAMIALGQTGMDIVSATNVEDKLVGIITNGDIERAVLDKVDIYNIRITEMINRYPIYVDSGTMAIDALKIMIDNAIQSVPVVKEERVVGILSKDSILKIGIYV